jgi:hypothetical protein
LSFNISERQILFLVIGLLLLTNVLFYVEAVTSNNYANKVINEFNLVLDSNYCVFPERIVDNNFDLIKQLGG